MKYLYTLVFALLMGSAGLHADECDHRHCCYKEYVKSVCVQHLPACNILKKDFTFYSITYLTLLETSDCFSCRQGYFSMSRMLGPTLISSTYWPTEKEAQDECNVKREDMMLRYDLCK